MFDPLPRIASVVEVITSVPSCEITRDRFIVDALADESDRADLAAVVEADFGIDLDPVKYDGCVTFGDFADLVANSGGPKLVLVK